MKKTVCKRINQRVSNIQQASFDTMTSKQKTSLYNLSIMENKIGTDVIFEAAQFFEIMEVD